VPGAIAHAAAFGMRPGNGAWKHLDRTQVAGGISARVMVPDGAEQGGNGLCTTAAFINLWAQDAPDAYAAFATSLFERGEGDVAPSQGAPRGLHVVASPALRGADYAAIAQRMTAKSFPVPPQADWMVMSAIRDSSNGLVDFTGDPEDWLSHVVGDGGNVGDEALWLRSAGAWSGVVTKEPSSSESKVAHALALEPERSRIILTIDPKMLGTKPGVHSVVLRSKVTRRQDDIVDLKVWTWAKLVEVHSPAKDFEKQYLEANIAFL
jgi:hypothetical protein